LRFLKCAFVSVQNLPQGAFPAGRRGLQVLLVHALHFLLRLRDRARIASADHVMKTAANIGFSALPALRRHGASAGANLPGGQFLPGEGAR
jgi:hypothetical protein